MIQKDLALRTSKIFTCYTILCKEKVKWIKVREPKSSFIPSNYLYKTITHTCKSTEVSRNSNMSIIMLTDLRKKLGFFQTYYPWTKICQSWFLTESAWSSLNMAIWIMVVIKVRISFSLFVLSILSNAFINFITDAIWWNIYRMFHNISITLC